MIDLVYIFGKGSLWKNNELRYSMRSVEMYLQNYDKVFLIGYKPEFASAEVIEIPHRDIYANKARNIMAKIYRACNDERISENFILFNDDYLLLDHTNAVTYPYYYDKDLQTVINGSHNAYKKYIEDTALVLKKAGKSLIHFDTHYPIVYNKTLFKKMVAEYNWDVPYGYIVKSMYCNHLGIEGVQTKDCKINYPYRPEYVNSLHKMYNIISVGDKGLNPPMKAYIMNRFPTKSRFEI